MNRRVFKVHTDTFGRLVACIRHAMYGVTQKAIQEMPSELRAIDPGDIVFISERELSNNALFGPFYVLGDRDGVTEKGRKKSWIEIDTKRSSKSELAYYVEFEKRYWCLLFDKSLSDKISIVWPPDWRKISVNLPSWGLVSGADSSKLIDYAIANEEEAKEFFKRHDVW